MKNFIGSFPIIFYYFPIFILTELVTFYYLSILLELWKIMLFFTLFSENIIGFSFDGAANMRSENVGVSAFLKQDNPNAVFTWCASHRLNLAVNSGVESSVEGKTLLGLVEETAIFLKESYKRMDTWSMVVKDIKGYHNLKKLQLIGKTRWWSKEKAIRNLIGTPLDLFVVLKVLDTIENSDRFDGATISAAKRFKKAWLEYDNIITALAMRDVLTFVLPATNYLQTKGLNISAALKIIRNVKDELKEYRDSFELFKTKVDTFICDLNVLLEESDINDVAETKFKIKTIRKKKMMSGEKCRDETPTDPRIKFKNQVFLTLVDVLICKIDDRFLNENEQSILREIVMVSPENLDSFKTSMELPKLCALASIKNQEKLKTEILSFYKFYKNLNLKTNINDDHGIDDSGDSEEDDSSDDDECSDDDSDGYDNDDDKDEKQILKTDTSGNCTGNCKNCIGCILFILQKFKLFTKTYKRLFKMFRAILTLPSTQVHCERSFSKLKIVKNRLRANLSDSNLESYMICNIESDILSSIDNNKIIDKFASTTPLLTSMLIHK